MSDIIERLDRYAFHAECPFDKEAFELAADEITRLREENARLRETLQYIADPYNNGTTSKDRLAFLARKALGGGDG